ncbi:hypothetical protein CATMIT_02151 [Catenibacterium mitsuokai DSM 15897]|uniref:phage major capsid protein n=1 Tax=Catenibacterium mitsuokai TaxID=100886 RepID=UPI000196CAEE|nr:hypothetical protein [Catenibacterium mitsuokai]EEF93200.1 hypothetical protein CATMIT_02151 [Catenibacterium mitsuokai DSM 15897]UWO51991.1 hypothetical protein NQ499_06805 [Catenibacterium mitsuokai]
MAQNPELQERYSSLVLAKQRKTSLFIKLFNKNYDGTPTAGAVKIPVRDTEVAVNAYDKTNGVSLTSSATSYKVLVIDNDNAVNELIDNHTAASVPDGLVAERLDSAGYSMAMKIDTDLGDELVAKGTAITDTKALTKTTVYDAIIDARTQARKAHIAPSEMWLAVSTEMYGLLLKSDQFVRASDLGDSVVQTGAIGKIGGILVYEADNLTDATVDFILGNNVYCHYVDDWMVPVTVNDLADGSHIGACAVQGRDVYGYMISRPDTVLVRKHAS